MISLVQLDELAVARLDDAKALVAAARYDGATYLCGYAIEVGLKATVQQGDAESMIHAAEELLKVP